MIMWAMMPESPKTLAAIDAAARYGITTKAFAKSPGGLLFPQKTKAKKIPAPMAAQLVKPAMAQEKIKESLKKGDANKIRYAPPALSE